MPLDPDNTKIKLAMGQLLLEGGEPDRNLVRAEKMIQRAKEQGADLIILPEAIDFVWTHPSAFDEALPIPGKYSDLLCQWAKTFGIYICVGLTERHSSNKLFNTAILIDDKGTILTKYHKINLIEVEQPFYEVGNVLSVIDSPWGKIGINICADNYRGSVHIAKTLCAMGAQIILSPSSWTVDHSINEVNDPYEDKWIAPLSYIADMYNVLVISTTSVGYIVGGPYEGKKMIGCSLAVDRSGIIKQGPFNEFAGELIILETVVPKSDIKGDVLNKDIKSRGFIEEVDFWKR